MADFANAVVKFKIRPEFKDAFEKAFKNVHDLKCDYLDFGFDHITTTGKYMEKYDEDYDYLNFDVRVGCNFNLEGEFSIPVEQGINGDNIATLCFSKKWSNVNTLKYIVGEFLDYVADEVVFCEIIGLDKITFSSDDLDEYYHLISYEVKPSTWGYEFTEIKKERIDNDWD